MTQDPEHVWLMLGIDTANPVIVVLGLNRETREAAMAEATERAKNPKYAGLTEIEVFDMFVPDSAWDLLDWFRQFMPDHEARESARTLGLSLHEKFEAARTKKLRTQGGDSA